MAQDELATRNLTLAARAVARIGGVVLVEPVSGAPRYPLLTAADVVRVIDRVGEPNVKFLCDLYHLAVNGDNVAAAIEDHVDRIGHVQIADSPGRGEPGTGTHDIAQHLAMLAAKGDDGYVALEYKPTVETGQSLAWLSPADRPARWRHRASWPCRSFCRCDAVRIGGWLAWCSTRGAYRGHRRFLGPPTQAWMGQT